MQKIIIKQIIIRIIVGIFSNFSKTFFLLLNISSIEMYIIENRATVKSYLSNPILNICYFKLEKFNLNILDITYSASLKVLALKKIQAKVTIRNVFITLIIFILQFILNNLSII